MSPAPKILIKRVRERLFINPSVSKSVQVYRTYVYTCIYPPKFQAFGIKKQEFPYKLARVRPL